MSEPFNPSHESVAWVADTGLFIECGRQQNNKYTALERFTKRNDLVFVVPQRVYDELGAAPNRSTPGQTPIDSAIDVGWVRAVVSIDFDQYSAVDELIDLTEGTNARALLSFLLEHPGVGFTPAELHDQTDIPRGSINPTLARLERAGLVRHKGDYWAAQDDDRIATATASVIGLAAVADTYDDD